MNPASNSPQTQVLLEVFQTILERKRDMPKGSYVASLLRSGTDTILCKMAEETGEVIKAAREEDKERLTSELCDLFFHAFVLMANKDVSFEDIEKELAQRHGISGLEEKASRPKK